ncbi:MAG: hypothetical protein ACPGUD_12620 [Parashewanella sp.]
MNFYRTILSLSIASLLTACGGSSNDDKPTTTPPPSGTNPPPVTQIEYKVIDGYLANAEVCIRATATADCNLVGKTDENGVIKIASDKKGQLVATIKAGETTDKDIVGFVGNSYQMVADISASTPNVITPFTTLDALDTKKSMDDIAADLDLPKDLLAGDYVASEADKSAHVHAIARSFTKQLAPSEKDNDVAQLHTDAKVINDYINTELANNDTDLDTVNVTIENGKAEHEKKISKLEDFLEGRPLYFASLNSYHRKDEGVFKVSLADGKIIKNGNVTGSYSIDGDILKFGDESDKYIYTSDNIALAVPQENVKDLILSSPNNFELKDGTRVKPFTKEEFVGNSIYTLWDDSLNPTPKPFLASFTFAESKVSVDDGKESFETTWFIERGKLIIVLPEDKKASDRERGLELIRTISSPDVTIIHDVGAPNRAESLMFKDENLARTVHSKWISASK